MSGQGQFDVELHIRVPGHIAAAAREMAAEEFRPLSGILRELIVDRLRQKGRLPKPRKLAAVR